MAKASRCGGRGACWTRFLLVACCFASVVSSGSGADVGEGVLKWAVENGAVAERVGLQRLGGDHGYSLVAEADIEQGGTIMSIPAGLLFPTRVSEDSIAAQMLKKAENTTLGRVTALCLYLMAERPNKDSFWATWIASLPTEFGHALSYKDEDMEIFQASAFRELRERKKANVRKEYDEVIAPMVAAADLTGGSDKDFGFEAFQWAYSVVTTRSIFPGLLTDNEREGDVPVIILGPLSDSLLHGVGSTAISYSADSQIVTFKALQGIAKGDRISIGCGLTSNLELLANRGSVLPANRNNFVLIKFQLDPESDMHAGARQSMLAKLNLTSPMTYIVRSGEMPQGLLTSLRIQSMTPVEFALYEKAAVAPLSLENEWRSYRLLISSCNTILSMYKTSVEEDDELLRAGILTNKASLAVTLRRQEKLIYDSMKAWTHDAWSSLLYAGASSASAA